jgi:MraZ protein
MPDAAQLERTYSSLYRHSVDEKRRVPIPFRWRPEDSVEFTIVVWPKYEAGTCLRVLPPSQWAKLQDSIDVMPNDDPNKPVLKHWIGTGSIQAKLDTAGRMTIPEDMAEAAGITNQAVLAGMINRFEIWNPERYERLKAAHSKLLAGALRMME